MLSVQCHMSYHTGCGFPLYIKHHSVLYLTSSSPSIIPLPLLSPIINMAPCVNAAP